MSKPKTSALHAELVAFALALPGAFEDHPWGEIVAKVGKKVFVFFGTGDSRDQGFGMSVKLPQSASVALGLPFIEPTGYGLGKSGWVSVTFPKGADMPAPMFKEWILESYRAVAPKTLVKQLDAVEIEPAKKKVAAKAKPKVAAKAGAKATAAKVRPDVEGKPAAKVKKASPAKAKPKVAAKKRG